MDVLRLVLAVLGSLRRLLPLPDLDDSSACRVWVGKLMDVLGELAATTSTTIDDAVVSGTQAILADDKAWAMLYGLVHDLLCSDEHDTDVLLAPGTVGHAKAAAIGQVVGFPVTLILVIVGLIVNVIRLIIEWVKKPQPEPAPGPEVL